MLIGARYGDANGQRDAGESHVVFGRTTGFQPVFELGELYPAVGGDGSAGFVVKGIDAGDLSGFAVSAAGDVNGDGVGNLLIGAHRADPNGRGYAGESYVVFGRATGFPATFELRSLQPRARRRRQRGLESYVIFGRATGFPAIFELRSLHPDGGGADLTASSSRASGPSTTPAAP